MDWERGVWWLSSSRWARKSLFLVLFLLGVWALQSEALIEWQQERLLERMQPFFDRMTTVGEMKSSPSAP